MNYHQLLREALGESADEARRWAFLEIFRTQVEHEAIAAERFNQHVRRAAVAHERAATQLSRIHVCTFAL